MSLNKMISKIVLSICLVVSLNAEAKFEDFYKLQKHSVSHKSLFRRWISVPQGKIVENIDKNSYSTIIHDLNSSYDKADFIGLVSIKKLKINKYKKSDNARFIDFQAEVHKVYKGEDYLQKSIKFRLSLEVEESFSPEYSHEVIVVLNKNKNLLYVDPFLMLPPKRIFVEYLKNKNYFTYYWEYAQYDKWYDVPTEKLMDREDPITINARTKEQIFFYLQLYKEADFIGVFEAKKYKKVSCDTESSTCGDYKSKVLTVFKGNKKIKNILFYNNLREAPTVYADKGIYILYKGEEMYYQDEFIQIDATKEWINFFNKLSNGKVEINNKIFKSLYSFCKATGIKESEIRKLNPWINKDATNISADAEIVVPISSEEKKYER